MRLGLFSKKAGRVLQQWTFDANATLVCPPTVSDLEGNGRHSIVVGTKDGRVLCLDSEGKELWTFRTGEKLSATDEYFVDQENVHSIHAPPLAADVNMDGKKEIIVGTELGVLYCLSHKGKVLWKHACSGSLKASAIAEDVNMDGKPEIVVGSTNKTLTVLASTGDVLFEHESDAPIESVPGVIKTGKETLIIYGDNKGKLTALTPTRDVAWQVQLKGKITAAPALLPTRTSCVVTGTLDGSMYCISAAGEIIWEFKTGGSIYSKATITDLDDDGRPEIVFGSCDNNIYAITATGQRLWSYETDFWITGTPIVSDLNGDGFPEVIAGSYDHSVYVLDSKGQYMMDYVPGVAGIVNQAGHYSNILTSDVGEQTGKKLYRFKLDSIVVGCTVIEQDDGPVIVVNTKKGQVSTLKHTRQ